jgi:hypothetical protein
VSGLDTSANGSGDSTRIAGVCSSKDFRVYAFPSTSTDVTVGNCVSV